MAKGNGIKVARGCPPPYGGVPKPKTTPDTVPVKTLIHALDEIQKWAGSVKTVLNSLPAGTTIPVKRKAAKKKAKKKAAAGR